MLERRSNILKGRFAGGKQIDRLGAGAESLLLTSTFSPGRFGRMIPLMMSRATRSAWAWTKYGCGDRGDEVEIIGDRGALVVDLSAATNKPELGAFNVTGASVLPGAWRPLPPACPQRHARALLLRGDLHDHESPSFRPYYTDEVFHLDMLGDSTISNAMSRLIDSSRTEVQGLAFDVVPRPAIRWPSWASCSVSTRAPTARAGAPRSLGRAVHGHQSLPGHLARAPAQAAVRPMAGAGRLCGRSTAMRGCLAPCERCWGLRGSRHRVAAGQTAIAIGGALRLDNDEVWQRIVDEAGGPGAHIAVFATAAGNPERSAATIAAALARRGPWPTSSRRAQVAQLGPGSGRQ